MMNRIARGGLLAALALTIGTASCKKDEEKKPEATPSEAETVTMDAAAAAAATPDPAEADSDEDGDHFHVAIEHAPAKPDDPVMVKFPVTVTGASFSTDAADASKLDGATATFEIDLTGVDTGVPKRDAHLNSPDYFDTATHPKATVAVSDVKAKDGEGYTAKAEVTAHGKTQAWPVAFVVVEESEDTVTVEAEHTFNRTDFDIGKAEGDPVAVEATASLRLTLQR